MKYRTLLSDQPLIEAVSEVSLCRLYLCIILAIIGCSNDPEGVMNAGHLPEGADVYAESLQEHSTPPALLTRRYGLEVCAEGETTFGIDVSKWQGDIDWARVSSAGVKYAIIRVSDGVNTIDEYFETNWAGAKDNGILRGAYQFFRPGQDPIAQAEILVRRIREEGPMDLPPVIDIEAVDGQSAAVIQDKARRWIDYVEVELGVTPIIYTGFYFWRDNVGGTQDFNQYPLWHAQYTSAQCPRIADAWDRWALWQYTSEGRVDGIDGNVDLNRFNGTYEELLGFAQAEPPRVWGGHPREQTFPLASEEPISLCVGERLSGELHVDNTGTVDWDHRVRLAPTPRDVESPLADESWLSPTRVTSPDSDLVAVGERGVFSFTIKGGAEGLYDQTFGLVAEGEAWFADQGGPHDQYIQLIAEVSPCPSELQGAVERVTCEGVEGWVWDQAVPSRWVEVEVVATATIDDTEEVILTTANLSADPACDDEGPCRHLFKVTWPETWSEVDRSVTVSAYDALGEVHPLITTPRELICGEGAGEPDLGGAEGDVAGGHSSPSSGGAIPGGARGEDLDEIGGIDERDPSEVMVDEVAPLSMNQGCLQSQVPTSARGLWWGYFALILGCLRRLLFTRKSQIYTP
jgi:lysozyme